TPFGRGPGAGRQASTCLETARQVRGRQADARGQLRQAQVRLRAQQGAGGLDQLVELLCRALALRRTAPAGAEAGSFGAGAIGVEANVLAPRAPRRAARPAIDTGAAHGEDEVPVLAGVACTERLPAAIRVEHG